MELMQPRSGSTINACWMVPVDVHMSFGGRTLWRID